MYPSNINTTVASPLNTTVAKEQAAILAAVNNHDEQLNMLHDLAERLFDKLQPVLSAAPVEAIDTPEPRPALGSSGLYYRLEEQNYRAASLYNKLDTLREMAEV